jgi:thioredoxin-dependent peroxiredoxin
VEILGVSFDTVPENAAFAKKFAFPYPLLCDTKRELGMAYGACDSPTAAAAARITCVIGPDGKILQVHPKVSPKSHPAELLASL